MTALATVPGIRIDEVKVGERARKDYGDLTSLKDSIGEHGLLQPIVLLPDLYLLCGGRRLEACKQLGWESIPYIRVDDKGDAISRLKAERDENTCRKEMTPSELVAIGRKLEELKRPDALARQGTRTDLTSGSGDPEVDRDHANRREVAEAVGLSEAQYARAKRVVELSEDETAPESVRAVAVEARDAMDRDVDKISIFTAAQKVADAVAATKAPLRTSPVERAEEIRKLAPTGMTSGQIGKQIGVGEAYVRQIARDNKIEITADEATRGTRRNFDGDRIINACVMDASNLISPSLIGQVKFAELNRESLGEWVSSLSESIRALQALKRSLEKELNRG